MKLQILVPRHNEPEEVICNLLNSISMQRSIDFSEIGVIICEDGSSTFLSKKFLEKYPFEIINIKKAHTGVSNTRNVLFDNATADYIMYCDADDMFYNVSGLWLIFEQIDRNHFDALYSVFIEETIDNLGSMTYIDKVNDNTFIHGKVYRRQYLLDEGIRWLDDAIYNEDAYYNFLAINSTPNVLYVETPFYMWVYNKNSVVRSNPDYAMSTIQYMIQNDYHLVDEFIKRDNFDKAVYVILNMVLETYWYTHRPHWLLEENREAREKAEIAIGKYISKYANLWDLADDEKLQWVWENLLKNKEQYLPHAEIYEDLDKWLYRVIDMAKNN